MDLADLDLENVEALLEVLILNSFSVIQQLSDFNLIFIDPVI